MLRLPDKNATIELSIHVNAPCEHVFRLFTDLKETGRAVDAPKIKMVTKPPIREGTEWVTRYGLFGLKKMRYIVTVYESPTRFTKRLSGNIMGTAADVFESVDDGTRVTRRFEMERFGRVVPGDTKWAEWMGIWETGQQAFLERFKIHVEHKAEI